MGTHEENISFVLEICVTTSHNNKISIMDEKNNLLPSWVGDTALNKQGQPSVSDFKKQDRDPHKVNDDVQINFSDIIAEPDSFQSTSYVWTMSKFIFAYGKDAAYQFMSFVLGVPLSCFWGLFFALAACMHVWVYSPLKRSQSIKMGCWSQFLSKLLSVIFDPFFESVGKTFSEVNPFRSYVKHEVHTVKIQT